MKKHKILILVILFSLALTQAFAIKKGRELTNEFSCQTEKKCMCKQMTRGELERYKRNNKKRTKKAICSIKELTRESMIPNIIFLIKKILKLTLMILVMIALWKYINTKIPIKKNE